MSDHAAVKDEHRKRTMEITDILKKRYSLHDVPLGAGEIGQLLADFARDERLKEAERAKQVYYECQTEDGWPSFETSIDQRIEQLKRGEL